MITDARPTLPEPWLSPAKWARLNESRARCAMMMELTIQVSRVADALERIAARRSPLAVLSERKIIVVLEEIAEAMYE